MNKTLCAIRERGPGRLVPGVIAMALAAAAVLAAASARAQNLPMAGDGQNLWLVDDSIDREEMAVLHRSSADEPGVLREAYGLNDRLMPGGIAADNGAVWLVTLDGRVRIVRAERSEIDGQWVYSSYAERRLPQGVALRAFMVADGKPWLLVRVESAKTLEELDGTGDAARDLTADIGDELLSIALNLPPGALEPEVVTPQRPETAAPEAPESDGAPQADARPQVVSEDRLITLQHGQWRSVGLPTPEAGWRTPKLARLVAWSKHDDRPTLFVSDDPQRPRLWKAYRWVDDAWQAHEYVLDENEPPALIVVDGQAVAVQERGLSDGQFQLRLSALRRGEAQLIGLMPLPVQPPVNWNATAVGLRVVVIASALQWESSGRPKGAEREFTMAAMGVDGSQASEAMTLQIEPPTTVLSQPDYVVPILVLVVATVLMFVFWRREPRANRLILPDGYQLADLPRRGIAGLIDLAPAMLVAMLVYGTGPRELLMHWPGQPTAGSWAAVQPGLLAIVVFLVHTTVAEAITGRSLGKWLTGLSIRSLTGKRAAPAQAVIRGVLKVLDLIAWLLLLLPIIGPFRQRLGDLVARTVVVMPEPEEADEDEESDEDES